MVQKEVVLFRMFMIKSSISSCKKSEDSNIYILIFQNREVNSYTPVAQKVADEVAFRCFRGEELEFFLIGPH